MRGICRHKWPQWILVTSILGSGCGTEEHNGYEGWSREEVALWVVEPGRSGTVTSTADTVFKQSEQQSSQLTDVQKCSVPAGTTLRFRTLAEGKSYHYRVELTAFGGCSFTEGYFYQPHVEVAYDPEHKVVTKLPTILKARALDSRQLGASEKCGVAADQPLFLTASPTEAASNHVYVKLSEGTLPSCSVRDGYLYRPHLVDGGGSAPESSFEPAMKHILYWEGGCSDHPNDPGGRTYMGITTERARLNGWTKDVCTMPRSMVLDIYRKDYWNKRAHRYGWPLNLAVMNTEVNSGGGRAQQFIDRMAVQKPTGTLQEKASWFVDQQTAYYRYIADRNAKLRVFLRGWLNRSAYMQDVVWGRRQLLSVPYMLQAKAWDNLVEEAAELGN